MVRRMKNSADMFRVLSTRRTTLPLTALLAMGAAVQAQTLRDPTRPVTARESTQSVAVASLQLEAVMGSGARRLAIVNGKIVRAGDRVGGALIQEIGSDSIRYTRNGRSETVRIAKDSLRVRESAGLAKNEAG
jgi:MSHA biogenesis protein MshK